MGITIKDVAEKAGVATSTVSRVINNSVSISEKTKNKVNQVMDELGYTPNSAARNLGKGRANSVALILPPLKSREEMSIPFFLEIIESINEEAQHCGLSVSLAIAKNFSDLLSNVKRMHAQKQVDGFILLYSNVEDPVADYLYKNKLNFSLVGLPCDRKNKITYVDNNNKLLGHDATDYLIKKGHKNILFVTNRIKENVHLERFEGYKQAMSSAGLNFFEPVNIESETDFLDFSLVLEKSKITAVVIIEDLLAFKVMQYVKHIGYMLPQQLSVISFNNTIFSTLSHPYITNVDINISLLAKYSFQYVIEQINGKNSCGMKSFVPHKVIEHESVTVLSN